MYISRSAVRYLNVNLQKFDRDYIAAILDKEVGFRDQIEENLRNGLIPAHEVGWIENSSRQAKWIEKNIIRICNKSNYHHVNIPEHLYGRERSIALFDFRSTNPGFNTLTKVAASEKLRLLWEEQEVRDRKFDWLKSDGGESQRLYLWQMLQRRHPQKISHRPFFQTHDDVLIFLYEVNLTQPEIELLELNTRKLWNQQRRREQSKHRKQVNFELSTSTIQKLEKLAKKHNISRTELVEILISAEARDEYHVTNILNKKHLLIESANY